MRFRSWIVTTFVIAVTQAVLSLLLILQHNALYSELLRQRVSVIAQTTADSFRPLLDLGLPISMLRDGDRIAARGIHIDPEIVAVHAINPAGIVAHSTAPKPAAISDQLMLAMRLADDDHWGLETQDSIFTGFTIRREPKAPVSGAIVVEYPHAPLDAASRNIAGITLRSALAILVISSLTAFLLIYLALNRPRRKLAELSHRFGSGQPDPALQPAPLPEQGALDREFTQVGQNLNAAGLAHDAARNAIAAGGQGISLPEAGDEPAPESGGGRLKTLILARVLPITIAVVVVSAIALGAVVTRAVTRSIEPELAARTDLIGTVVSENVQRALETGIGLDEIVGADRFFGDMLERLPEVAYIAIATGRIVIEAGERIDPYLAPPRERRDVRSHPILHDGEEVAYVIIDIDPRLIAQRFRGAFLDAAVILLVTILLAWEAMLLLSGRTLTGGLARLETLSALQAFGDFSRCVTVSGKGAVQTILRTLSKRAVDLHRDFETALGTVSADARPALERVGRRFGLVRGGPFPLALSSFADIRLALFLFAAADELPLAFLPLYTRAATNLWPWLDQSILIALPLAGYLIAILVMSPYARKLVERFGVRGLFCAAAIPTLAAHIGLFAASTAQEIILWRTVTGFGYAIVTLAAQDYVLNVSAKSERDRTLGMFTLVLFGGIFSGVALGGVLADRLGPANVFLVSAALIGASAVLSRWLIPSAIGRSGRAPSALPDRRGMWRALADRRLAALVFGVTIPAAIVTQAFVSYLVALTLSAEGASAAETGRILMLYFLTVMTGSPLAGRLLQSGKVPGAVLCIGGAAVTGLSLLPVALSPGQLTMVLAMVGTGVGGALIRGTQVSLALSLAETVLSERGPTAVLGALRTSERLGSIVGLVLLAWLAGAAGYPSATLAAGLAMLAGGFLFAAVHARDFLTTRRSRPSA